MTSYLLNGPDIEPVTLAQAKEFLRFDNNNEDDFINSLITAARLHVESVSGRALISQSWRLVLDEWPKNRIINLPIAPLISLSAINIYDEEGNANSLSLAQFQAETKTSPARIFLPRLIEGQINMRERQAIEIDFLAGYGATEQDVPNDLKIAIFTLIAHWFEHRDALIIAGSGSIVPAGFDRIIAPYKIVKL